MNDPLAGKLELIRSALFMPASNARAIAKAQQLDCDMAILDLEDSVRDEDKQSARDAAVAAIGEAWRADVVAIRVNASGSHFQADDLRALASTVPALIVAPKIESAAEAAGIASRVGAPLLAMIETAAGVYASRDIAAADGVAGLIMGSNDLAAGLRLPPGGDRAGLMLALQAVMLAARAAGGIALDGVYNRLDDSAGFEAECREGRTLGFDGKTLIHPSQIDACNRLFGPSEAEIEDALALIEAASGGAERFRGRMIEAMHVATAHRILARARR